MARAGIDAPGDQCSEPGCGDVAVTETSSWRLFAGRCTGSVLAGRAMAGTARRGCRTVAGDGPAAGMPKPERVPIGCPP